MFKYPIKNLKHNFYWFFRQLMYKMVMKVKFETHSIKMIFVPDIFHLSHY